MWRRANQRLPLLLRHLWWLLRPMLVWLVSSLQICRRQRCLRGRVQVAVEIAGGVAGMLDQAQTRLKTTRPPARGVRLQRLIWPRCAKRKSVAI